MFTNILLTGVLCVVFIIMLELAAIYEKLQSGVNAG